MRHSSDGKLIILNRLPHNPPMAKTNTYQEMYMTNKDSKATDSSLMKIVQAIAITPDDARMVVRQYEEQIRAAKPAIGDAEMVNRICQKIVTRYAKLSAISGGATGLAGVVPGVGTAVSLAAGTTLDVSACIKFQVDMTMCLAIAINKQLSNEDAKHLSFLIALFGSLEQAASKATTKIASKAGVNMVNNYLKGPILVIIKELFQKIGIQFTKKATIKVIPFGGVRTFV